MEVQAAISRAKLARKVGRALDVLVDEVEGDVAIGRGPADAPEIDGVVRVEGARAARVGEFLRVKVTGSGDHDLTARAAPSTSRAAARRA
jgi:ribosomal protein S12 methylthiotransferase